MAPKIDPPVTFEERVGRFFAKVRRTFFPPMYAAMAAGSAERHEFPLPILDGERAAEVPSFGAVFSPIAFQRSRGGFSPLGFLTQYQYRSKAGRVVNTENNLPLKRAIVTLYDAQGNPRQSVRTRRDGNFVFLLPPGQYAFSVAYPGYDIETSPDAAAVLPGEVLYQGAPFTIDPSGPNGIETLSSPVVLAMKPTERTMGRAAGSPPLMQSLSFRLRVLHARLALPLLLVGALLNSIMLILNPNPLLVASEILYGVLLSMELLLPRFFRRTIGRLRDAFTKHPISLALVRLVSERTGRIAGTYVTTAGGFFLLLSRPGWYRLGATHPRYQPQEEQVEIPSTIPNVGSMTVRLRPRAGTPTSL